MNVANGVEALELESRSMGQQRIIYPTLIWDKDVVILVDAGYPGLLQGIREAVEKTGVPFGKLDKVVITHQDVDHIGSLPDILKASDYKVEVLAHAEEKPYIQGEKPLIKMNSERMGRFLETLPEERRQQMIRLFENPPKAKVDVTISDGEVLPYCGGITVIFTPGHTPGHICLYLNRSKTLVTGDALIAADGRLLGPRPEMAEDTHMAVESLKKLTQYDIQTVICYHGGVFQGDANKRIAELANGQM